MVTWDTDSETVHALLVQYLSQRRGEFEQQCAAGLKRGKCVLSWDGASRLHKTEHRWVPTGDITYILTVHVQPDDIDFFTDLQAFDTICDAFRLVLSEPNPTCRLYVKALVELPAEGTGLNNCFFKTDRTITHDELRFRSRAEVVLYDELKRRNVLFFPNPAAVLGNDKTPELAEKREPDFLICSKGKWGILEVNGEPFHSGPVTTAKDHERFRLFQRHGLFFVQAYDADRCRREPAAVVNDFLKLLDQSR